MHDKERPEAHAPPRQPAVALTIDTEVHPPKILLIRGRAELDVVGGFPEEYLQINGSYKMTPEQRVEWEAECRRSTTAWLGATAAGELVAASSASDLAVLSVLTGPTKTRATDSDTLRTTVTASWTPPPRFPTTATWRRISSYPMERGSGSQATWPQ